MSIPMLCLCILLAYGGYCLLCRPRRIEGGARWLIIDASDGPLRGLIAGIALVAVTVFLWPVFRLFSSNFHEQPEVSGAALVCAGIALLVVWWHEGKKVIEAVSASPGELRIDAWPLQVGEHVEVSYKRRLRAGRPAGEVEAALVLYTRIERRDRNGQRTVSRVRSQVIPLQDGEAEFSGGVLEACWRFEAPHSIGDPHLVWLQAASDIFSGRRRSDIGWVLEVQLPLQGGVHLDSHFALKFDHRLFPRKKAA